MTKKILTHTVAALTLFATAGQAVAGGRAVECYERYRTPPVYGTVHENVMVDPGYTHEEVSPPIYGTRSRQVLVAPQRIKHRSVPALYEDVREKVLIEPARTIKRKVPAVVETRYRTVQISDGGYSWEWRIINGRKVLCKIKHKARYQRVAETVVVEPARYVHETIPAQYGYQERRVLVTPESTESYVLAPEYETYTEQVVIQPERRRRVHVAPSYETVRRQVVVSDGEEGWRQVRIPKHCRY